MAPKTPRTKKVTREATSEAEVVKSTAAQTATEDGVGKILSDVLTANHLSEEVPAAMVADDSVVADMSAAVAEPKWYAEKAVPYGVATTNELFAMGLISRKQKDDWDVLLKSLETHYDVFSMQASILWKVLDQVCAKADMNVQRLFKIQTYGFMDKNIGWMSCVIRTAKARLELPHSIIFPGSEGFVPQTLEDDDRLALRRLISQLNEIAKTATCETCGEWVGFDKVDHKPFKLCKDCRKAEKVAAELRELNLKMVEKNGLLRPLDELLTDVESAGAAWVEAQVKIGRLNAKVAYDYEFRAWVQYYIKTVKELPFLIKTGAISEDDKAAVEKLVIQMRGTVAEIKAFRHLTWCACGTPTYPEKGTGRGKKNSDPRCAECRKAAYQKPVTAATESVTVEVANALAVDGIFVQLADEQAGEGLKRFNRRVVAADCERARREEQGE